MTKKEDRPDLNGFVPLQDILPHIRDSLLPDEISYINNKPYVYFEILDLLGGGLIQEEGEIEIEFTPEFDLD